MASPLRHARARVGSRVGPMIPGSGARGSIEHLSRGRNVSTTVHIMSTKADNRSTAERLMGKAKAGILSLLYTHADQAFYVREITRLTGLPHGQVPRELGRLTEAGLLTRRRRGQQVFYQANHESPIYEEIRSLIVKTSGVGDVIRESLDPLADEIDFAFIYGSFARGEEREGSDVDVLVIGDVGFRGVVAAMGPAQRRIGREVNATVMTSDELEDRVGESDPFLLNVLEKPKIMLMGDDDELRRVGS
ncbi:MAG: hypothetical protein GF320_03390 [Armatimonadia bacterium]|nr:hypothetical protein [Armatimonadia bacterium]